MGEGTRRKRGEVHTYIIPSVIWEVNQELFVAREKDGQTDGWMDRHSQPANQPKVEIDITSRQLILNIDITARDTITQCSAIQCSDGKFTMRRKK